MRSGVEYQFVGNYRVGSRPAAPTVKGDGELSNDELRALSYQYEQKHHGADGLSIERRTTSPQHGLLVPGGFLLASSRGEFGGELVFQTRSGVMTVIVDSDTVGIHSMAFGIVAVTAPTPVEGILYLVEIAPNGLSTARRWKVLLSSPQTSAFRPDGSLRIDCDGDDVVLTPGGELKMVE
jgi:hypothetical protein